MNVRFSENEIRFRVTSQEFDRVKTGEPLQLETIPFTFIVQMAKKPLAQGMVLDLSRDAVHLVISPEEIESLQGRLPSRHGIEKRLTLANEKTLDVAFEIDIR